MVNMVAGVPGDHVRRRAQPGVKQDRVAVITPPRNMAGNHALVLQVTVLDAIHRTVQVNTIHIY